MRRISLTLLSVLLLSQTALAASGSPVMMEAREVGYDREHGIVTALGNVEVTQDNRIVLADRITYNLNIS